MDSTVVPCITDDPGGSDSLAASDEPSSDFGWLDRLARALPAPMLRSGDLLDDLRIERLLGAGSMGQVYAARRTSTNEPLAVKLLAHTDPTHLLRFKREFRALADVEHENLVRLGDLRVLSQTRAYITMELILGQPFVQWVRQAAPPGRLPNLARLRRALRQLVAGAQRLHREGLVHRDLKPSNVLVTAQGRVVILDFGLIRESGSDAATLTYDDQALGTPAYMAPEQGGRARVGPAADWYAVGVMLYECLTGVRPFVGSPLQILRDKELEEPPDPAEVIAGMPERLRCVCLRLLAREPAQRAGASELLEAIGDSDVHSSAAVKSRNQQASVVGRERELERMHAALRELRSQRRPVVVRISGASGVGKSTLVRRFLADLEVEPDVIALRGRCLERESLPFKGIDGIVDALGLALRRMSELEAAELRPRQLGALARLFPTLANVWSTHGHTTELEPLEVRRLGIAALRELLERLGDQRVLVLSIDDFQWADSDSARLLIELLRPLEPPALLLLVSHRDPARNEALELLRAPHAFTDLAVHDFKLAPLSCCEARCAGGRVPEWTSSSLPSPAELRTRAPLLDSAP